MQFDKWKFVYSVIIDHFTSNKTLKITHFIQNNKPYYLIVYTYFITSTKVQHKVYMANEQCTSIFNRNRFQNEFQSHIH